MREAAIEVLARHDVPGRLAEREARADALHAVEQERASVAAQVPWWERAAFFRDSPDELRAAWLADQETVARRALDEASVAVERAVAAAVEELPVLGVATRVERLVARSLADPSLGLGGAGDEAAARELTSIADDVGALWVPGIDARAVLEAVADDDRRAAAAAVALGEPRRDPRLGWAPITPDELIARAAGALRSTAFATLRASLHREASEHAALASRLRELRRSAGTLEVMTGRNLDAHHAALAVEAALPREHAELVAAFESFDHALLAALGAFPPMRLALAAQRAAGVLEARLHVAEPWLDAGGAMVLAPSPRYRALFLAALGDLRTALDQVLPGVGALVGGRGGARDAADLARAVEVRAAARDAGPYRQRGSAAEEPPAPSRPADLDARIASALDALGLAARRDRALAHAAMIASLARWRRLAGDRVGVADRLAFWSSSAAEETAAALDARERWHRGLTHALVEDAVAVVRAGTHGVFPIALRDALLAAHVHTDRLGTRRGSSGSSMSCPVFHHGDALAAVDGVGAVIARSWGLRGGRADLVAAVTAHLRAAPPMPSPAAALTEPSPLTMEQVVISVAEALRGGPWLAVHDEIVRSAAAHAEATAGATAAEASISTWDRINVLTDTPAEAHRDACAARALEAAGAERTARAQLATLLDAALGVYPPGAAYFGLEGVRGQIAAVRAVLRRRTHTRRVGNVTTTSTTYHCELLGKAEALAALRRWTVAATGVFGRLPSDGEILARVWSRALLGPA